MTTSLDNEINLVDDASRALWLADACKAIDAAPNRTKSVKELTALYNAIGKAQGIHISVKSMERKYYQWRNSGRVLEALFDKRRKGSRPQSALYNSAFRSFIHRLRDENSSLSKRSICAILRRKWKMNEPIPGYVGQNTAEDPPYPAGWSVRNLSNIIPPHVSIPWNQQDAERRMKRILEIANEIKKRLKKEGVPPA